jgi:phosphoribosylaminoimidazole-succinocarboxamide synthase
MTGVLLQSDLPLKRLRRGKVRDVYEVDASRVLVLASDRISAFDVVMAEGVPHKGRVLTQLTAWWLTQPGLGVPHHMISADAGEIVRDVSALAPHRDAIAGRAMLCRRAEVFPVECVVRGYISGSAWKEYAASGSLAGEPLPAGLQESQRLEPPVFSPATKAEEGHDENITFARMAQAIGPQAAGILRDYALRIYGWGAGLARERGVIIADTKFELGLCDGQVILVDEVMTPDSSRFWPADGYAPGRPQPSFDKQPLRDWLDAERRAGRWNGEAPAPPLPDEVVAATSRRYLEIYRRLTGHTLAGAEGNP